MRFDAVAFDLDGTLYPAFRIFAIAFSRMLPMAHRLQAFNATRRQIRALESDPAYRRAPPADGEAFRAFEAELFAKRLGMDAAEARKIMDRDFYFGLEELFSKVRPYNGLSAVLGRIEGAGLRVALLSDLPPARKLELMGFAGRFEPVLCSEDSGFLKPARESFAMLASRLALSPERILYVGNSPSIDVAGAKGAGMSAAIIALRRVKGADLSFSNWDKLADFATSSR